MADRLHACGVQQALQQFKAPGQDSCGSPAHLVALEARLAALRTDEDAALSQLVKLLMGSEVRRPSVSASTSCALAASAAASGLDE